MTPKFGRSYPALNGRLGNERLILFLVLAFTFFIAVVFLFVWKMKTKEARSSENLDVSNASGPSVGVVTLWGPEHAIRAGAALSDVKFKEIYWPRNQVLPDHVLDVSEIKGFYAKADIPAGTAIKRSDLTKEKSKTNLPLTPGNRAVSIDLDETSGLEGHAQPGTHVDVVLTYQKDNLLTSQVIVQNARVISLNGDLTPGSERSPMAPRPRSQNKTITLDVTPEEALLVTTARQMGRLSLLMRANDDTVSAPTTEISRIDIAGGEHKEGGQTTSQECNKGKMKMGGKEFIIKCDGSVVEVSPE